MCFPAQSNPQACEENVSSGKDRPPLSDTSFLKNAIHLRCPLDNKRRAMYYLTE